MLVGRDSKLARIRRFIGAASGGPWVVVLAGEAGIGKTALWRTVLLDVDPGTIVLMARAAAVEASLSYAVVTDLLAAVPDTAIAALPSPQATALDVLTLHAEAPPDFDGRISSTALTTLLGNLAADAPVVVAIDDVQWVDAASREALEFALRRMSRSPVGVLVTVRGPDGAIPVIDAVDRALVPIHTEPVGPLTLSALHHVIRHELGDSLRRPALVRVTEMSGGNPMLAIELARALEQSGAHDDAGARLPMPNTLAELTTSRLAALSARCRDALLLAAVSARPTVDHLEQLGVGDGLGEAETAGVVELRSGVVTFTHPLLAAAAIEVADAGTRRDAHARLAAITTDLEARSRHAALASTSPDEPVAAALDAAVDSSHARGATVAAAELAQLAVDLTPDTSSGTFFERLTRLGDLLDEAGDATAASVCLRRVLRDSDDPNMRAVATLKLTGITWQVGSPAECRELCELVLAEPCESNWHVEALMALATIELRPAGALAHVRAARALIESEPDLDQLLLAWALVDEAGLRHELGEPLDLVSLDRALALEREGREWQSRDQVGGIRATILKHAGEYKLARDAFQEIRDRAGQEGNIGGLPFVVGHLVGVELALGDLEAAQRLAEEHLQLADATGQVSQMAQAQFNIAHAAAHQGRHDHALAAVDQSVAIGGSIGSADHVQRANVLRARILLWQGDAAAAAAAFNQIWDPLADDAPQQMEGHLPDLLEALIIVGDLDRAAAIAAAFEPSMAATQHPNYASLIRTRAQLLAARGDVDDALVAADDALALHDVTPHPFERARTLLLQGQLFRRAKQKGRARDALTDAKRIFEEIGAGGFAARAAADLGRVNIRPPAPLALTATERRIAELAAQGMTNREIAGVVFVSPKTVEANLARAYRKLGIRSRAELGARLLAAGGELDGDNTIEGHA